MFAVIYIPDFQLQAVLRHEPELQTGPVALVTDDSAKAKVWQATVAARAFGISPGMTSTQAKARCEEIVFRLRSIPQEESAQEVLLECAYLSAAFIEATAPGVCTADLRGLPVLKADSLLPALTTWAEEIRRRLRQFHLDARIGVASAPALAAQAAQGQAPFTYISNPAEFWDKLPIRSLEATPDLQSVLTKWGIHSVGQFLALGKGRIAERLGAAGVELFDRAKADVVRPLKLTAPRQVYEESFEFEQPIETLEPLLFSVRRLLEQLLFRLELVSLAVGEFSIALHLDSGERHTSAVKIAAPTRDPNVLFRVLHNYLETVRTRSAIAGLSLGATACAVETEQFQLFESSLKDPNRFFETISRLSAMLGPDRVGTPVLRDSHRADDFEMVRPHSGPQPKPVPKPLLAPGVAALERRGLALRRFRPALHAAVRLRKNRPVFLTSTGPSGSVVKTQGPWRSSGNWWESLWAREEWDIQMKDGSLHRIFFENNQWFVEGSYD